MKLGLTDHFYLARFTCWFYLKGDKMATRTNPQVDRYQLVKLRSNIRDYLLDKSKPTGPYAAYGYLLAKDWIPFKSNGELLGVEGFISQYNRVKRDLNHNFSDFSICFLHRCFTNSSSDNMIRKGRNGLRVLQWMTGLQEVTIKDILILNGEMR